MTDDKHQPVFVQSAGVTGVASSAIDALKTTPMLLVMVLLNLGFIGAAAYYLRTQQETAFQLVGKVLDRCMPEKQSNVKPPTGVYPASPLDQVGKQ